MDLNEFLSNIPTTTRERASEIKNALKEKDIYASVVNKNEKKYFKLYFYNGDILKTKQLKITPENKGYVLMGENISVFSEKVKDILSEKENILKTYKIILNRKLKSTDLEKKKRGIIEKQLNAVIEKLKEF